MPSNVWELALPSDPKRIADVEKFLNKIFAETGWEEEIQANIGIALTEVVNNAILHGNKSDHRKKVEIRVHFQKNIIEILVSDEGSAEDEIDIPDPTQPENLLKTNGRGLFLVEHFMDEVKLIPTKTGTTVSMKLKLTG